MDCFFKWTHGSFSCDFWSCLLKIDLLKLQKHDLEHCHFLPRVDNCLQSLVGILTGNKIELQEQVAWCLTNVASGRPEHALAVAKAAAPYFITYVSGSSPLLQVLVQGCGCMCVMCRKSPQQLPPIYGLNSWGNPIITGVWGGTGGAKMCSGTPHAWVCHS